MKAYPKHDNAPAAGPKCSIPHQCIQSPKGSIREFIAIAATTTTKTVPFSQPRHRQALILSEILMKSGVPAVQHLPERRTQLLAAKQGLRLSVGKKLLMIWGVATLLRVRHGAGLPRWLQVAPLAVLVAYSAASGP